MSSRGGLGPPDEAPRFALRAARLFDGHGGPARSHPLIIIEDGRVGAIEDARSVGDPGCPLVDLGDVSVLPGLIDAHTHLAWLGQEEADRDPDALLLVAADRAARTLAGGVTLARDLGAPGDVALRLRDAIAAGVTVGPRLLVSGPPLTTPAGHCHWLGRQATTVAEVRAAVGELAAMGVDVIKLMLTGGMTTPTTNPAGLQYPSEVARAAVDAAHHAGLPVAAHTLGSDGIRAALSAGVDTLEHGWTITGREQHYDVDVIDEVRASSIVASVTAHQSLRVLLPDDPDGYGDIVELRRRLLPHRALAAAGVPLLAHSDAGPPVVLHGDADVGPTRYEGFGASLAVFAAGMETTAAAAIGAATLAPARALGVDATMGSLGVGRVADLVTLEGDPERDLGAFRRIRDVRVEGRLVARNGAIVAPNGRLMPPVGALVPGAT